MRILYLDCGMGAAGDMLGAALLELVDDKEEVLNELNSLGIPGVHYELNESIKCGIKGSHLKVTLNGLEEGHHDHEHEHDHHHHHEHEHHHHHEHEHGHHHHSLHDIHHIVEHMPLDSSVKSRIMAIYDIIAKAESQVHGTTVEEVHFHEVGAMDAVADVAAVCILMDKLKADKVVVSPIHVGSGTVQCAHGILPVPAPATANILEGVPIYGGSIQGELCTPTGAALIKYFATEFGPIPSMSIYKTGYGMGRKDFERVNGLRALLGENKDKSVDEIIELSCNIDDMTGEEIGFAMEAILEAGAVDVYTMAIGMKKSRPGELLCALCAEDKRDSVLKALFTHTTTIGVRESIKKRYVLDRELITEDTEFGPIRYKRSRGYGVNRIKAEYEDLNRIAKEKKISIRELKIRIENK